MKTRIITALIGLPVFIGVLYLGGFYTDFLVLAMIIAGITEIFKIIKIEDNVILSLLYIFSIAIIFFPESISFDLFLITFMFSLFACFVFKFKENLEENRTFFVKILKALFIYLYITIPFYHLILLRNTKDGFKYILFMFVIIWVTDSFAYFTGMAIGKNKLAPNVSPKKTIEGSVGGAVFALFIALYISYKLSLFTELSLFSLGLLILLLTIISQLGDLFESSLKRIYQVKDSGKILPGHGGVLDRFDSTIFVAPIFYIILNYLIH